METPPQEPLFPGFHFLLNLGPSEKKRLTKRVKKWNGLIRIFVHPLYEKWTNHESEGWVEHEKDVERHAEIEMVFARLLSMPEDKTPPLITFEENWALSRFRKWLRHVPQALPANIPYVINTMESSPDPYYHYDDYKSRVDWDKPKTVLKELGVQKILIGGISLDVAHTYGQSILVDWTGKSPYVCRCVGVVLSHLSKDKAGAFETELSSLIYPRDARGVYLKLTDVAHNREFECPSFDF
jgi:hypothetical protein